MVKQNNAHNIYNYQYYGMVVPSDLNCGIDDGGRCAQS